MNAAAPAPRANQGAPVVRYDAHAKVTGAATYASDTAAPRAAFAYLVTSKIGKGRITGFDEMEARGVPGVLQIVTYKNRPELKPVEFFFKGGPALTSAAPMDGPEIHYAGQIIAMIVAESFEGAREAAHRLVVRTRSETPAAGFGSPGATPQKRAEATHMEDPKKGDAIAALAGAAHVVEARYSTPPQHHVPIELYTDDGTLDRRRTDHR